ncbi:DUF4181 domain-containing protein [Bacillus infantis]|uniref:DUF4181 domain-containing protein n=1 Tax=Bacillus infantis TaxID=324767 RepID=UPI003CEBE1BE
MSLLILFLIGFVFDSGLKPHYPVMILSILLFVRAIFERIYKKETRRYILSTLTSLALLIMFAGIQLLFI